MTLVFMSFVGNNAASDCGALTLDFAGPSQYLGNLRQSHHRIRLNRSGIVGQLSPAAANARHNINSSAW